MKPERGKPAFRNFREDDGNGGIIRSPIRAIVLPGGKLIRANVYLSPKVKMPPFRTALLEADVNHPESGAQPTPHAASIF